MTVRINNEVREFDADGMTVEEMLRRLGFERQPVIVERNGRALVRSEWASEPVVERDVIEIVRLAAGG